MRITCSSTERSKKTCSSEGFKRKLGGVEGGRALNYPLVIFLEPNCVFRPEHFCVAFNTMQAHLVYIKNRVFGCFAGSATFTCDRSI